MPSKKLPLPIALMWVIGSTFVITGSAYSLLKTSHGRSLHGSCKEVTMLYKIIQTGPHRDALTTDYLAEIMGLSRDHPTSQAAFDVQQATAHLIQMPMIKEAHVSVLKPDTVYVDYTMRQPIAMVYDYENTAVDEEGFLFPFSPFFSPKALPELYFGSELSSHNLFSFHTPVQGRGWHLAMRVLKLLKSQAGDHDMRLKRIDVSHAFEKSLGRQEIVIDLESEETGLGSMSLLHRLRLHPKDYEQQLGNYFVLHEELETSIGSSVSERVIDLRMNGLAFMQEQR